MTKLDIENGLASVQAHITQAIQLLVSSNDLTVLDALNTASQALLDLRILQLSDRRGPLSEAGYRAIYTALMSSRLDASLSLATHTQDHRRGEAALAVAKADAGLAALAESSC